MVGPVVRVVCLSVCDVGVLRLQHLNGSSWFSVGWIQQRTAAYVRWGSGFATFHIVSDTSPEVGVGLIKILPGYYSF